MYKTKNIVGSNFHNKRKKITGVDCEKAVSKSSKYNML